MISCFVSANTSSFPSTHDRNSSSTQASWHGIWFNWQHVLLYWTHFRQIVIENDDKSTLLGKECSRWVFCLHNVELGTRGWLERASNQKAWGFDFQHLSICRSVDLIWRTDFLNAHNAHMSFAHKCFMSSVELSDFLSTSNWYLQSLFVNCKSWMMQNRMLFTAFIPRPGLSYSNESLQNYLVMSVFLFVHPPTIFTFHFSSWYPIQMVLFEVSSLTFTLHWFSLSSSHLLSF